ncbi:MAG: hypothetical protein AB7I98_09785 [Verrucomicrobiales bacterium]
MGQGETRGFGSVKPKPSPEEEPSHREPYLGNPQASRCRDEKWTACVAGIGNLEDAQSSPEALNKLNQVIFPCGKTWPPPNNSGNYWDAKVIELSLNAGVQPAYADGFKTPFTGDELPRKLPGHSRS